MVMVATVLGAGGPLWGRDPDGPVAAGVEEEDEEEEARDGTEYDAHNDARVKGGVEAVVLGGDDEGGAHLARGDEDGGRRLGVGGRGEVYGGHRGRRV